MADIAMPFFSPVGPFDSSRSATIAGTNYGIVMVNQDGTIRTCNGVLQTWLGTPIQEVVGRNAAVFLPGLTLPVLPVQTEFSNLENNGADKASQKLILHRSDEQCVSVIVNFDVLQLGDEHLYIGVLNYDQGQHARRRSMEDFMFGAMLSSEAVAVIDRDRRFEFVNDAFEGMTGYCSAELIGQNLDDLLPEAGLADPQRSGAAAMSRNKKKKSLSMHRKKNGDTFFFLQTARDFIDVDGAATHTIVEGRDISATVAAHDRLSYLAHHDNLTGLPSRVRELDYLQQAIAQAEFDKCRFSIAIVDIDEFKRINDCYGHGVGDVVLRDVADRIKSALLDGDSVGRLSGDEFLIVMPHADSLKNAQITIKKIHDGLSESISVKGFCIPVTVSIGAAIYPENGSDQQSLLEYADLAMYREKSEREPCSRSGRRSRRAVKFFE